MRMLIVFPVLLIVIGHLGGCVGSAPGNWEPMGKAMTEARQKQIIASTVTPDAPVEGLDGIRAQGGVKRTLEQKPSEGGGQSAGILSVLMGQGDK